MSKNEPMKIAEGKWSTRLKYDIYAGGYFVGTTRNSKGEGNAIDAANAELIADAGNAYQATGLLPSEMAEQLAEARELLKDAVGLVKVLANQINDLPQTSVAALSARTFNKMFDTKDGAAYGQAKAIVDRYNAFLSTPNTNDHG